MSVMETERLPGRWTVEMRNELPDDGRRYEVIDGVLYVNAAPRPRHQIVQLMLAARLLSAAPQGLWVLTAPTDVVLSPDDVVQPDVLVAPKRVFGELNLPTGPMLAAEVASPSTYLHDLNTKKDRYERAGVPSYWIVDPNRLTLTVFELVDGRYELVAEVGSDESWTAERPFPVTIAPGELVY
ncbi:MAG: Uma2 family endonuclease [Aeromicrobium sp.]|uniref:Uma2 family endonuclease n=1 Tax=Aeromicrobium sp. TaxID=1871063 RepID=UPI0039E3084C